MDSAKRTYDCDVNIVVDLTAFGGIKEIVAAEIALILCTAHETMNQYHRILITPVLLVDIPVLSIHYKALLYSVKCMDDFIDEVGKQDYCGQIPILSENLLVQSL